MKKIIDIIKIDEVNTCYNLEVDSKIMYKILGKYVISLTNFKSEVNQNSNIMSQMNKNLHDMTQKQTKKKKKRVSEIDYYSQAGIGVINTNHTTLQKIACFYARVHKRICKCEQSIKKFLQEFKKKQKKFRASYQKQVKQYAGMCFPETKSLMFALGLTNPEKIKKKQDCMKEQKLILQTYKYVDFLQQNLAEMQNLKQEALCVSKEYFQGAKQFWINNLEQTVSKLQELEVDLDQLDKIGAQIGNLTDRSGGSIDKEQEFERQQYKE